MRYALKGDPYTIHFFLDDNISESKLGTRVVDTYGHPRHVGSVYNFSTPIRAASTEGPSKCANCEQQRDDGVLSTAQVPLTIPLYTAAASDAVPEIENLAPEVVEEFLTKHLTWIAVSVR